jgi:hypothetical protein
MRRVPLAVAILGLAILIPSGRAFGSGATAGAAQGAGADRSSDAGVVIRMPRGPARTRIEIPERGGVIRLFRVQAPAGSRVRVTSVIPGVAGISTSIPAAPDDPAETCTRDSGALVCTQAEEWCPMPAATWLLRVRKLSGPAGRIRIAFVVAPARARMEVSVRPLARSRS